MKIFSLFKKKPKKEIWYGTPGGWWMAFRNSEWWKQCVAYYKKDVDENVDEEKEAQAIYSHWIKSYMAK